MWVKFAILVGGSISWVPNYDDGFDGAHTYELNMLVSVIMLIAY